MESYDRFFDFLKRSKAISPTVALETATVLQVIFFEALKLHFIFLPKSLPRYFLL